jgi:hypothetical protein
VVSSCGAKRLGLNTCGTPTRLRWTPRTSLWNWKTAAEYFVDLLAESDRPLRGDRYLFGFLQEVHEQDEDLIGDLVAETIQAKRTAGSRLRDVIQDTLDDTEAREHLGWLAAAAITDRLQTL